MHDKLIQMQLTASDLLVRFQVLLTDKFKFGSKIGNANTVANKLETTAC